MAWQEHVRIVARFNLGPGTSELENASCTLNFTAGLNWSSTETMRQAAVDAAYGAWASYVGDTTSGFTPAVRFMECRCYLIDETGHAQYPPTISTGPPVKGINGGGQHPYQVSNVLSLVASPGGKGRFGRIYLPPQGFAMDDASGLIHSTSLGMISTRAFQFLDDISDLPGIDAGWGLRIAGSTGTGTLREVEEVRFGRAPDTQRRRRRNLEEAYVVAPFDA